MKIKDLLKDIKYTVLQGHDCVEISDIHYDSRRVTTNSLFVCIRSVKNPKNELNYINDAINNGAKCIVVDYPINIEHNNIAILLVGDTRKALPVISATFYNHPSRGLNLIGVTGTNGKTSVSMYVAKVLEISNKKHGVIGTMGAFINGKKLDSVRTTPTTPESLDLQQTLKNMKDADVTDVIMEVSSMALELDRVSCCDFDIAVFTNLSQEHLDDHKTMENYKRAKLKLFKMCKIAIINDDDPVSQEILENSQCRIITYGINKSSDISAKNIEVSLDGVVFTLVFNGIEKDIHLKIPGKFSVYNALATVGICYNLGISLDEIVSGLENIEYIAGRFETIVSKEGYQVVIDYAHTPNALENILCTVKGFVKGRIITVFGCGGDRDRSKRSIMGEISGKYSNSTIITSDNPRTEDPLMIINEIEAGLKKVTSNYKIIENRKTAITFALRNAKKGDVVIIAGKGHEEYQILKDGIIFFSDREVVNNYLNNIN
jgi:UDP-N-acetylmuramoyl-L-alanyl-D-glutamate--2,6-diaminopimelate ligase